MKFSNIRVEVLNLGNTSISFQTLRRDFSSMSGWKHSWIKLALWLLPRFLIQTLAKKKKIKISKKSNQVMIRLSSSQPSRRPPMFSNCLRLSPTRVNNMWTKSKRSLWRILTRKILQGTVGVSLSMKLWGKHKKLIWNLNWGLPRCKFSPKTAKWSFKLSFSKCKWIWKKGVVNSRFSWYHY